MIRLAVFTPDTPPKKVAEVAEPQLGHLEVFDDAIARAPRRAPLHERGGVRDSRPRILGVAGASASANECDGDVRASSAAVRRLPLELAGREG